MFGFQSKERILLDEEIKGIFDKCEADLTELRSVFKLYQNKNKRKVEQDELEARSRNITLLRKNLNLLGEEFKIQANKSKKAYRQQKDDEAGVPKDNDSIDIFGTYGKNKGGGTGINDDTFDDGEEDPLNEDELSILKQFEQNDQELEDIAAQICGALDDLQGTAENMKTMVKEQGSMLRKTRESTENTLV